MFFQSFVLFTAFLSTVVAVTPYTSCTNAAKVQINDFNVNDCQSTPCEVNRLGTLRASINVTALEQLGAGGAQLDVNFEVSLETFLGFIPVFSTTDPLCGHGLQCPVQADTTHTLTKELQLIAIIPKGNFQLELSISEGAVIIACLQVDVTVV